MGPSDVVVDADWMQVQLNDPGMMLAEVDQDSPTWTRRRLLCSCDHGRAAHRHYRSGSECAVCACRRWSPPSSLPWLARRGGR